MDCHCAHIPCEITDILACYNRRTAVKLEKISNFLTIHDVALVKMKPTRPMCVEW